MPSTGLPGSAAASPEWLQLLQKLACSRPAEVARRNLLPPGVLRAWPLQRLPGQHKPRLRLQQPPALRTILPFAAAFACAVAASAPCRICKCWCCTCSCPDYSCCPLCSCSCSCTCFTCSCNCSCSCSYFHSCVCSCSCSRPSCCLFCCFCWCGGCCCFQYTQCI